MNIIIFIQKNAVFFVSGLISLWAVIVARRSSAAAARSAVAAEESAKTSAEALDFQKDVHNRQCKEARRKKLIDIKKRMGSRLFNVDPREEIPDLTKEEEDYLLNYSQSPPD